MPALPALLPLLTNHHLPFPALAAMSAFSALSALPALYHSTSHFSPLTSHHLPLAAFPAFPALTAMSALSALSALKEQKVTLLFVIGRLVSSCLLRLAFEQVEEAS
jgi:hypothetical protein